MMSDPTDNTVLSPMAREFQERARALGIFDRIESVLVYSPRTARLVGALWYRLSEAIVDVLCLALARLRSPELRHLVVQTAYEEPGEDSPHAIYTKLLLACLGEAGVGAADIAAAADDPRVGATLDDLRAVLEGRRDEAQVCGLLLGMEIVALENIDLVLHALTHEHCPREVLIHWWT